MGPNYSELSNRVLAKILEHNKNKPEKKGITDNDLVEVENILRGRLGIGMERPYFLERNCRRRDQDPLDRTSPD